MEDFTIVNVTANVSGQELKKAEALIFRAAEKDGQKAVSDQALIEAGKGLGNALFLNFYHTSKHVATGIVREVKAAQDIEIDLVVDPEYRNQKFGAKAFQTLLNKTPKNIKNVRVWVHGEQPGANKILETAGFKKSRTLLRLSCAPEKAHHAKLHLPAGFELETFSNNKQKQQQQLQELSSVNARAFADHPEQGSLTVTDFKNIMAEDWFNPADLMLCYAHEPQQKLAGFAWIKTVTDKAPEIETELYVIGVDPDFAGQGLGSALMDAVFVRMAEHNPTKITLYVEGDNDPALKVYYRAGFTVATESIQWQKTF